VNKIHLIRGGIITYIILGVIIRFLSDFERELAPSELVSAFDNINEVEFSFFRLQFLLFALSLLALHYISCLLMLFRINWSKYAFVITIILVNSLHPFLGYHFIAPWTAMLESLNMVLSGVIVGVIFFAPETYFKRAKSS
jgi:hypothetical protein